MGAKKGHKDSQIVFLVQHWFELRKQAHLPCFHASVAFHRLHGLFSTPPLGGPLEERTRIFFCGVVVVKYAFQYNLLEDDGKYNRTTYDYI
jgi:hypothetical protein